MENNIIHDTAWAGSLHNPAMRVQGCMDKTACDQKPINTIRRNTIYNTGSAGIYFVGQKHLVEYNHVHHGGLSSEDVSLLYTIAPTVAGSVVAYNWVHDSRDICIRGDDFTYGLTLHHNVVWNCGRFGVIVKGDENRLYNNTILGELLIPTERAESKPWRVNQYPPIDPQNGKSEHYNNVASTLSYRVAPLPSGSALGNNVSDLAVEPLLMDPSGTDFRPKASATQLVDQGRSISGVTDGHRGAAPDVGAYEADATPWTPGSTLP